MDDVPSLGDDTFGTISSASTLSVSAQLYDALKKLSTLSKGLKSLSTNTKVKDKSLGNTINNIRRDLRRHEFDILQLQEESSSTGDLFGGLAPLGPASITSRDRKIVADEVAARLDLYPLSASPTSTWHHAPWKH